MRLTLVLSVVVSLAGCGGKGGKCGASNLDACEYGSGGNGAPRKKNLSVTDGTTGRVLPVLARLPPTGAGPFPVVVWSHGGGFADNGQVFSPEWAEALARHGFAVLNIGHVSLGAQASSALCTLGSVPSAECVAPADDDGGLVALVKARDVIAVLDALPRLKTELAPDGELDLAKVAVAGWSAGARGPLVTQGTTFLPTEGAPVYSAPHATPKAVVALSPMGPGWGGFYDDARGNSWSQTRGPVLVVTGNNDTKPSKPGLTGATRRVAYEKLPADGSRWLLYSKLAEGVGGHSTYNLEDLGSGDARVSGLSRAIRSVVLAYLDAELRGAAAAEAWLSSNDAKTLAGDADWEHK